MRSPLRVNKQLENFFSSKNGLEYANTHVLMEKMAYMWRNFFCDKTINP